MTTTTTLGPIKRRNGVAGFYELRTVATYVHHDAETTTHNVVFVGSEHGAPVVMITEHGQHVVSDWTRYGDVLNDDWVRRFFEVTE